jgi:putative zinc finger/helix-turn-helix YgiT family protein
MRASSGKTRRARTLPDEACPYCGTMTIVTTRSLSLPVNGEEVSVPAVRQMVCPGCDESMLDLDAARYAEQESIAIYRQRHGLLSADEICALRERLGVTQAELARLLRLGANTVSRWETGRNVQTAAMDLLLRIVRDVPGGLEYLRDHAA